MSKFDSIRPYYDAEVNDGLRENLNHPVVKALMNYTFPGVDDQVWKEQLLKTHSIRDFKVNFILKAVRRVIAKTTSGFTTSGFDALEKNQAYLFISNHRDIILDTSLINVGLLENGLILPSAAIGDNLVKKPFMLALSKLNRNFLVNRGLSPRETLEKSKLLSDYIAQLLLRENRSVWIAQRDGRTKDGNDATNPAVLKMITMGCGDDSPMDYLKKAKIVPVTISYEYDPTDALKMPQLLAEANDEVYVKSKNEDFNTLVSGIMGQKKRIHLTIGKVIDTEIDEIKNNHKTLNKQIQALTEVLDEAILKNYKLWPTNYVAYDILHKTNKFQDRYTQNEKELFVKRFEMRIDKTNTQAVESFLKMYANPVSNVAKYDK